MKTILQKWVIVPFLCWASYAYTQTTSDTLVANISDRARIVFIGQSKEDFKEIEKYDLNVVFKTLQQQAQNKKVTLTNSAAQELRNDAFLITKSKTSFWKKTHLNFYVGAVGGFSSQYLVYNQKFAQDPTTGLKTNIEVMDYATFSFLPQLNVGFGGYREKKIIQSPEKEFVLRFGIGYQRLKIRPSYRSSGYSISADNHNFNSSAALLDTIRKEYKDYSAFAKFNPMNYTMNYINLEFIPTYRKLNTEGKTKWELGIGFRGGIGGQGGLLRRAVSYKLKEFNPYIPIDILTTPKSNSSINFIPFDFALVTNIGYKYLKFFAEYHPYNFNLEHHLLGTTGEWSFNSRPSGLWSVGLRFGK